MTGQGKRSRQTPTKAKQESKDDVAKTTDEDSKPSKKTKQAPKKAEEQAHLLKLNDSLEKSGWKTEGSLLYRTDGVQGSKKIAAFDLDQTLLFTKSSAPFPRDDQDYQLFNKDVAKKLQSYVDDGFKIVVFSNQGGIKSAVGGKGSIKIRQRINNAFSKIPTPIQFFLAAQEDEFRKPETGMFNIMVEKFNDGIPVDKKVSFFCGDAAGRPGDIADSDKKFAEACGIKFLVPEDVFGEGSKKREYHDVGGAGMSENQGLADYLKKLADDVDTGEKTGIFKQRALQKVAGIIAGYPEIIKTAKQVKAVKGIGKKSLEAIDDYLSGRVNDAGDADEAEEKKEDVKPEKSVNKKSEKGSMATKFL